MKFEILGANSEVEKVVELNAFPIKIGKNANCDLCLENDSVSRVHAEIAKSGNGYKLSDRMSAGGTFVNQKRVSKPVMLENGALVSFGQVAVRVLFDDAPAAQAKPQEQASVVENAQVADVAATAMPTTPVAQAVAATPKATAKATAGGFGGNSGFGGGAFGTTHEPQQNIIIKKRKKLARFERRFLSARGTTGNSVLEVAVMWRDNVQSIKQYKPQNGFEISVGSEKDNTYPMETGLAEGKHLVLVRYNGNKWELVFNNAYDGFLLIGDNKTLFKDASSAEFNIPSGGTQLQVGSLACDVTNETRAKYIFGEMSVLVHYVEPMAYVAPLFGNMDNTNLGGLVASLLIHFALFSVILFATDRVDALMIDRIMTASRFAVVVEAEIEEEKVEEEEEEEEPDEVEPEEVDESAVADAPSQDTPFAANTSSSVPSATPGKGMSKGEAIGAAQATGLLAQSSAMNSMLAAGMDMQNLDNLDWSSFDASAQAASANYGLGTTGTGGGGAGLGGFGGGGFGPGGGGGNGAIKAAGNAYNADLGSKKEAKPAVKMKDPTVNGSIDKRIIQKVVRQHSGELRSCYERELAKTRDLAGRIVIVWLISPQGMVTKALVKETTMKNKTVEDCIKNSILHWRFPAPKGGGIVQIEYPFVFEMSK